MVHLPSKWAQEMHFVLVSCTLEYGLRLTHRLCSESDGEADSVMSVQCDSPQRGEEGPHDNLCNAQNQSLSEIYLG